MNTPVTLDVVTTTVPGLAPWQPLSSGHTAVDEQVPGTLLGRSVQLRFAKMLHGKTADSYSLTLANARDGVVLYAHTGEKTETHVRGMGLQHPSNRALAKNVRVKETPSLAKIAKLVYKGIATSLKRGTELPRLLVVDNVNQLLTFEKELNVEIPEMLEFFHAVAELDLEKMYQMTGASYEDVTDQPAPDLEGVCMAVVGYVVRRDEGNSRWGRTDTLPSLEDISPLWTERADSVVVLERYEDEGLHLPGENARITFLKRTFVSSEKPTIFVPMHYGGEEGRRPTWSGINTPVN